MHARSVVATAVDTKTGELFKERLVPENDVVVDWLRWLPGPVATAYEAGPTGFGLSRAISEAGIRCVVAAPSKLNRPSGDRVKTDARDALLLAKLLRNDDLTSVRVPSVAQEAARDLVRAREDVRGDLMRARHRVTKLLLRQGDLYCGGAAWTGRHLQWLSQQRFNETGTQAAFNADLEAVEFAMARRDRLDAPIAELSVTTGGASPCPLTGRDHISEEARQSRFSLPRIRAFEKTPLPTIGVDNASSPRPGSPEFDERTFRHAHRTNIFRRPRGSRPLTMSSAAPLHRRCGRRTESTSPVAARSLVP